jgi:hypothetical protein
MILFVCMFAYTGPIRTHKNSIFPDSSPFPLSFSLSLMINVCQHFACNSIVEVTQKGYAEMTLLLLPLN